jgi:hypothetical protein
MEPGRGISSLSFFRSTISPNLNTPVPRFFLLVVSKNKQVFHFRMKRGYTGCKIDLPACKNPGGLNPENRTLGMLTIRAAPVLRDRRFMIRPKAAPEDCSFAPSDSKETRDNSGLDRRILGRLLYFKPEIICVYFVFDLLFLSIKK